MKICYEIAVSGFVDLQKMDNPPSLLYAYEAIEQTADKGGKKNTQILFPSDDDISKWECRNKRFNYTLKVNTQGRWTVNIQIHKRFLCRKYTEG